MSTRRLLLMADYHCFPIWELQGQVYNLDPGKLPISTGLREALLAWSERYNKSLNAENPANSGFLSTEDEVAFHAQGNQLLTSLKEELGADYDVELRLATRTRTYPDAV